MLKKSDSFVFTPKQIPNKSKINNLNSNRKQRPISKGN